MREIETVEGYDLWASSYDALDNPMIAMTEIAMRAWAPRVEGARVLELGCGTGRNARFFLDRGAAAYVGVDGSRGMLDEARKRGLGERATWVHADLEDARVDEVDVVLVSLVLEHARDVRPALRAAARAARRGAELRVYELYDESAREARAPTSTSTVARTSCRAIRTTRRSSRGRCARRDGTSRALRAGTPRRRRSRHARSSRATLDVASSSTSRRGAKGGKHER